MTRWLESQHAGARRVVVEKSSFELHVRGEIPKNVSGSLIVPTSRRHKDRLRFSRWHDSQADLLKLDLSPGRPGRVRATYMAVVGVEDTPHYQTQPNHGVNSTGTTVWATNLLFGAPLEVDVARWEPRRVLDCVPVAPDCPQLSSTAHFARSPDGKFGYFHQSQLQQQRDAVAARALTLVRLDVRTGTTRTWQVVPPAQDADARGANFHSAFYFEDRGRPHVGLLRTGAIVESLVSHGPLEEHVVIPMAASKIWVVPLEETASVLQATLLPGVEALGGVALSHLDVALEPSGFVLYANFKQADVAEEIHGKNVYGETAERVPEHYAGMPAEPFNVGQVIRYEWKNGKHSITKFRREYVPGKTSRGHTWLPINIKLSASREHLFCSFAGVRPRLLPRHVAAAYGDDVADFGGIRHVPPLLMRMDARRLVPDTDPNRKHLSYAESIAFCLVGDDENEYVCTFAPDVGLRLYESGDLSRMIATALSAELMTFADTHFRPTPAHMEFVAR